MALVLSLKEGEIFYVENTPFIVRNVAKEHFYVDDLILNKRHYVQESKMTLIHPDVKASAGRFTKHKTVKLVIEAPRSISVMREERRNGTD